MYLENGRKEKGATQVAICSSQKDAETEADDKMEGAMGSLWGGPHCRVRILFEQLCLADSLPSFYRSPARCPSSRASCPKAFTEKQPDVVRCR